MQVDRPTVLDLRQAYAKTVRVDINRFTFRSENGVKLEKDGDTLDSYDVKDGQVVLVKDLGPQIGYKTVFIVEYAGPIAIMLLYWLRPAIVFGANAGKPYSRLALFAIIFWLGHFIKRELETFFVHKFSRPTMPLSNLFKNSIYYWSFALVIGYFICHPDYVPVSKAQAHVGAVIFVIAEIGNLLVHLSLSNMRPEGNSKARNIPMGALFKFVSCPNYTFEILSWIGYSIMTGAWASYLFTFVGFVQMAQWAQNKHQGYIKTNDEYKKLGRKAIVPFLY
jgi:very-long-chain enoyl-CoA reductase